MKNKLLLIALSSVSLFSCSIKDETDIYHGSSDMTANLNLDWNTAANKCSKILSTDFLPDNTYFCNEVWWDMTQGGDKTEQFVKGTASLIAQSQAIDVLLDAYNRTGTNDYLSKAESILASVYAANGQSYMDDASYANSEFMGITLLRLYTASKNDAYLAAAKNIFAVITVAATSKQSGADASEQPVSGAIGVPVSASQPDMRTTLSNATAVIFAEKLFNATNDQSCLDFASHIFSFLEQNLFDGSGQVYASVIMDELGTTIQSQDKTSYSAGQGLMIGASLALYNHSSDKDAKAQYLKYANLFAQFQVYGSYSTSRQIIYKQFPVFMPDYVALPGAVDRSLMLYRGIFFRYLKDLIGISDNTDTKTYQICLDNNVESMWVYGQDNESCFWGTRWYEAPYTGEYVSSTDVSDPYVSKKVVSLEAEIAGATLVEMKAELSKNKN